VNWNPIELGLRTKKAQPFSNQNDWALFYLVKAG
jgi:hypothetical protein